MLAPQSYEAVEHIHMFGTRNTKRKPKTITRDGKVFRHQRDDRYKSDDGDFLATWAITDAIAGRGDYSVSTDYSSYDGGGGSFGGGGGSYSGGGSDSGYSGGGDSGGGGGDGGGGGGGE